MILLVSIKLLLRRFLHHLGGAFHRVRPGSAVPPASIAGSKPRYAPGNPSTEEILELVTDALVLIDLLEQTHADKWPGLRQAEYGNALLDEVRPQIAALAAELRDHMAKHPGAEVGDQVACATFALSGLRQLYILLDCLEAELTEM